MYSNTSSIELTFCKKKSRLNKDYSYSYFYHTNYQLHQELELGLLFLLIVISSLRSDVISIEFQVTPSVEQLQLTNITISSISTRLIG